MTQLTQRGGLQVAANLEQVLSFTLDIADRFLVIDKGRFVYEETRDKVDAATISRYLSV